MSSESVAPLDATELTKHETFADGPPHELFDELREQEAAVDSGKGPEGNQMWSVCRHADIAAISRDTETFSSQREGIFPHRDQVFNLALTQNLLLYKDPPEHTQVPEDPAERVHAERGREARGRRPGDDHRLHRRR